MQYEVACGAVVYTMQNGQRKYVIIRQKDGQGSFYGFPKGHVEGNESEEETALREIREEVGLNVTLAEDFRSVQEYPLPKKPGVTKRVVYFIGCYQDQPLKFQKEELYGAALMSFEEAMAVLTYENTRQLLTKVHQFLEN